MLKLVTNCSTIDNKFLTFKLFQYKMLSLNNWDLTYHTNVLHQKIKIVQLNHPFKLLIWHH